MWFQQYKAEYAMEAARLKRVAEMFKRRGMRHNAAEILKVAHSTKQRGLILTLCLSFFRRHTYLAQAH